MGAEVVWAIICSVSGTLEGTDCTGDSIITLSPHTLQNLTPGFNWFPHFIQITLSVDEIMGSGGCSTSELGWTCNGERMGDEIGEIVTFVPHPLQNFTSESNFLPHFLQYLTLALESIKSPPSKLHLFMNHIYLSVLLKYPANHHGIVYNIKSHTN